MPVLPVRSTGWRSTRIQLAFVPIFLALAPCLAAQSRAPEWTVQLGSRGEVAVCADHATAGVRAEVTAEGLGLAPTRPSGLHQNGAWTARLVTRSFGREGRAIPCSPQGTVRVGSPRTELARDGFTEWFDLHAAGIEQGWTIPKAPAGEGAIWIGLALEGDLSMRIVDDQSGAFFVDASGGVCLVYRELRAFDAVGRDLEVRLAPSPHGPGIRVNDDGATYPVTVDPVIASGWLFEPNQNDAYLDQVSTAGDVNGDGFSDILALSDKYSGAGGVNEGRVWVFHGSSVGPSLTPSWMAEGGTASAFFGADGAGIGDVNGDGYDDVAIAAAGGSATRVFVYYGSSVGLGADGTPGNADFSFASPTNATWLPSPAAAGDVNGDGFDELLVGTNYDRVFVFFGGLAGLVPTPWEVPYPMSDPNACFGCTVTTAGDVNADGFGDIVIGARSSDLSGPTINNVGRAFAYYGSAGFASDFIADWVVTTPLAPIANATFGSAVSTIGDSNGDGYADVVIGARREGNGEVDEGFAHIYHGGPTGLATTPSGSREGNVVGGQFGEALTTVGDVDADGYGDFVVASPVANNGLGSFHVTHGRAGGVGFVSSPGDQTILLTTGIVGANGAGDISGAGDVNGDGFCDLVIAASFYSSGQVYEGGAILYYGQPSTPLVEVAQTVVGTATERLGAALTYVGDVNGDGRSDYVAGSPEYDNGLANLGRVTFYRGTTGLPVASWTYVGSQSGENLGISVSGGDVDNDGYSDIVVGGSGFNNGPAGNAGRVLLFLGGPSGPSATPSWTFVGTESDALVGRSVSVGGDVDGDGFLDVLVGGRYSGTQDSGIARLFRGNSSGAALQLAWTATGTAPESDYAASVSICGDVNRDGYSDLIVGSKNVSNGHVNEGRVYLHLGGPNGPTVTPSWVEESNQVGAQFGTAVGAAGDLNGDGYSDIFVAAPEQSGSVGAVHLFAGASGGPLLVPLPVMAIRNGAAGDLHFGRSVAGGGDVDGDGFTDLAIGIEQVAALSGRAAVALYLGNSGGIGATAGATLGGSVGSEYGVALAISGDVHGDGLSDLITSTESGGDGQLDLLAGGGQTANRLLPQQRRVDDLYAISLFGQSESVTGFRSVGQSLNATSQSTTPMGRERIRLEHEVAQLGSLLDGLGTTLSTSWVDTGPLSGTVGVSLVIGGLAASNSYRWRERFLLRNVYMPHTRWLTIPGNSRQESKFGLGVDCNTNGQADAYDIQIGSSLDCNANGTPDECDIASSSSPDCNNNASPDECDLFANDCDGNSVPDECQLPPLCPSCVDCNANFTVDACDVLTGGMPDTNGDLIPDGCQDDVTSFCSGDGSGTPCPCGNLGVVGNGCASSLFPNGANLGWGGVPAVAYDTFVLYGTDMPNSSALYFQGTGMQSGGLGSVFGDGLRCASGSVIRLGTKTNAGNASQYPELGDLSISVRGALPAIGGSRTYQSWYRNAASFCTASTFNLSNGLRAVWVP